MSLYGLIQRPGPSGFGYNSTAEEVTRGLDLTGKVFLITGSNSGIGSEAARVLAMRGARIIACARSEEKAKQACHGLPNDPLPLACELSEPSSVRSAVRAVLDQPLGLDGIIANAGIMALPERSVKHGLELQFLTNHIGHFILVTGLLEKLTPTARVVVLSSAAHHHTYPEGLRLDDLDASGGYVAWSAYAQSKLANLLFAKELANRLPEATQTANSVHPGVIATNLARHMSSWVRFTLHKLAPTVASKTIAQGAATQTYVATHPTLANVSGEYFADCNVEKPSRFGRDSELAKKLWAKSEELVAKL